MSMTIRSKVDSELTRRVGKWFTVREIQNKLKINPATLKPLIMKYARENVLRRRHIKGTARSVEFSPAAGSTNSFRSLLIQHMPYRNFGGKLTTASSKSSSSSARKSSSRSKSKSSKRSSSSRRRR